MNARIFVMVWALVTGSLMLVAALDRSEERAYRIAETFLALVCYTLAIAAWIGWGA